MADIALVSLALDSSAVVAGEKQATRALQTVDSAMQRTEKQAQQLNTGLNANLKRSGDSFKGLADGATRAGSALSGLGGPVGRFGSEIGNLGGQVEGLTSNFGLIGGAAIGAVAGVAALGAALTRLTLEGVALSDEMLDVAETTGLTINQVQRLSAAARLSGESAGFMEASFRTFQNVVQSAITDPLSDGAKALRTLGINAQAAGKDTATAFLNAITQLKLYRATTEGAAATNEVFGKQVGVLVRSSENLTEVLQGNRQALEDSLVIGSEAAIEKAGELDTKINALNNSWSVFKQNLAGTSAGAAIGNTIDGMSGALGVLHDTLRGIDGLISKSRWLQGLLFFGVQMSNPIALLRELDRSTPTTGTTAPGRAALLGAGVTRIPEPPGKPKAAKEPPSIPVFKGLTFDQVLKLLGDGLKQLEENAKGAAEGVAAANARFLEILGGRVGNIISGVPLPLQPGLIQPGGPGQPFPGAEIFGGLPNPKDIRTEEQARIDAQFALIFDDFMVTLLTAQDTLGGAFKGLALGLADTFAIELTKAMRESFINFLVPALTELLQEGISSAIGGLKGFGGGGVKGVFGGILKGIGTIFGGLFATGGTLAPGKFGIAGERGPELLYSGNQPLHIAPVSNVGGSGVISVNMNFAIAAPTGEVSQRTQDQIADSAMRGMERAQRLRGAR